MLRTNIFPAGAEAIVFRLSLSQPFRRLYVVGTAGGRYARKTTALISDQILAGRIWACCRDLLTRCG